MTVSALIPRFSVRVQGYADGPVDCNAQTRDCFHLAADVSQLMGTPAVCSIMRRCEAWMKEAAEANVDETDQKRLAASVAELHGLLKEL